MKASPCAHKLKKANEKLKVAKKAQKGEKVAKAPKEVPEGFKTPSPKSIVKIKDCPKSSLILKHTPIWPTSISQTAF